MNIIAESLLLKDLRLALKATDHRDAIEEILAGLRCDSRVRDWEKLRSALHASASSDPCRSTPITMCLYHARTESVSDFILCIGRSQAGLFIEERTEKIHLMILAALPRALSNDYLRVLGSVVRVCRDVSSMTKLLKAKDSSEFLTVIEEGCR